ESAGGHERRVVERCDRVDRASERVLFDPNARSSRSWSEKSHERGCDNDPAWGDPAPEHARRAPRALEALIRDCRTIAIYLLGRTHKPAFCKRGSVNVRLAPKATEVLRCCKASLCAMSGPTQCSKLHLRSNASSARATSSGESPPQQLGGGPDDFTIAFHNYGIDKARIVFQPLNMLHGSFVIRTNRRVQNADLIGRCDCCQIGSSVYMSSTGPNSRRCFQRRIIW